MGEERTPAVGVVSGAKRDARETGDNRRFDRVLEEDRAIEPVSPEFTRQAPLSRDTGMASRFLKGDDLVHVRREAVDLGDPGLGEDGNPRTGPRLPDGGDGGKRHDDVSDPVRSPDQHPFDPFCGKLLPPSDIQLHHPFHSITRNQILFTFTPSGGLGTSASSTAGGPRTTGPGTAGPLPR